MKANEMLSPCADNLRSGLRAARNLLRRSAAHPAQCLLVAALAVSLGLGLGCRRTPREGARPDQVWRGSLEEAGTAKGFYHIIGEWDCARFPLWYPIDVTEIGRVFSLHDAGEGRILIDGIKQINTDNPGVVFGVAHDPPPAGLSEVAYFVLQHPRIEPEVFTSREDWERRLAELGVENRGLVHPTRVVFAFADGVLPRCCPADAWPPR